MTTLVAAISDGFGALATILGALHKDIGWRRGATHYSGGWASYIYIQETRNGAWRIRRIDEAGVQVVSNSNDESNASTTLATAWTNRAALVFSPIGDV